MNAATPRDPWGQGIYAVPPERAVPRPEPEAAVADMDPDPPRFFDSVEEFVNTYLTRIVRRRLGQGTAMWCPEWWRHPEAVVRFDGLWRAFEYFVVDTDTGVSNWWLYHADPHLRALLDPDYGPFALCDPEDGHATHPLEPLPVRSAPPGTWDNPLFRVADEASDAGVR